MKTITERLQTVEADVARLKTTLGDGSPRIHGTAASAAAESPELRSSDEGAAGTSGHITATVDDVREAGAHALRAAIAGYASAPSVRQENPKGLGALEPPHYEVTYPTEEREAIARVREYSSRAKYLNSLSFRVPVATIDHVLAALDRATAEVARLRPLVGMAEHYLEDRDKILVSEQKLLQEVADLRAHLAERDRVAVRLHAQLDEKDEQVAALRAQLAARTDATPLGWVNVFALGDGFMYLTEERAVHAASTPSNERTRIAVPVYEHPPAAAPTHAGDAAQVTGDTLVSGCILDLAIAERDKAQSWAKAMESKVRDVTDDYAKLAEELSDARRECVALRATEDNLRQQHIEGLKEISKLSKQLGAYVPVGACVVRGANVFAWTAQDITQDESERCALMNVQQFGGTAHRLYAGERIGGGAK